MIYVLHFVYVHIAEFVIKIYDVFSDPWTMALSRSSNRKYYFNLTTGQSKYDLVPESISPFE